MSGVWHTSDLHLGHAFVARKRGFDTPDAHDARIAEQWCARVTKRDQVWVHGDIASGSSGAVTRALALIAELPGTKHLIAGNHDPVHPMHRTSHLWQRRFLEVFESVQPFARRKIGDRYVLLSHFPYDRDRHEPRYTQYRLRNEGMWLLHGHTHGPERVTFDLGRYPMALDGRWITATREVHVGLDAWDLAPVNATTISELIEHADRTAPVPPVLEGTPA